MKDKKDFFDMNPTDAHTQKVKSAVEDILAETRQQERRKWFQWLLVPAFASAAGLMIWKKTAKPNESFLADQDVLVEFDNANDIEIVADLELLEDLETLEEWDGLEEA